MAKSEPKTMRFEDWAEDYINKFSGNSFSERFHNMVKHFTEEEKQVSNKLKVLDLQIKEKEKRVNDLTDFLSDVRWLENTFKDLQLSIDRTRKCFDNFIVKDEKSKGKNL